MSALTSTLTIRLVDAATGPAKAAMKALKALDATARGVKGGAAHLDRTARALVGVDRSAAALAKTGKAMPTLTVGDPAALQRTAKGINRVARETSALGQAARAVSGVSGKGGPFGDLSADLKQHLVGLRLTRGEYRALARDFVRMREQHEKALGGIGNEKIREQVRTQDRARIEGRLRARAGQIVATRGLGDDLAGGSADEARARAAAGRRAAQEARRAARAQHREQHRFDHDTGHLAKHAATAIGLGYGVQGAERGAHYVAEQGAEAASESLREKLQGLTPEQIAETQKRAIALSAQYPSVSALTIREYARKATSVTGDYHHAGDLLEDMTRARVMLGVGKGGDDAAGHDVETIVQAAEGLNRAASADTLRPVLNAFVKAKALYGETVRADTFRDYTKQAGTSVVGLDDSYLTGVVPAMLQENAQWGVAQMTALGQMSRPVQKKAQRAALAKAGLLGKDNKIKGGMAARKNPYIYANSILTDALKGAGIDIDKARDFNDPDGQAQRLAIGDKLASWFPDRKASMFWEKQILDKTKIDRNVAQAQKATGLEGAPTVLKEDPYTGLGALTAQISNFVGVVSSPAVQQAGAGLATLAGQIGAITQKVTDLTADNPDAAKAASLGASTIGSGLLAYGTGSALMRLAGGAEGVLANGLRIGGSALQTGGATTAFGVPLVAGTVAGAVLDNNVSRIGGGETLTAARRAYKRRQHEAQAAGVMRSLPYLDSAGRSLAPIGDSDQAVSTPVTSSRGAIGDFLWGKARGTYDLPAFGFRVPGKPDGSSPPRRPVEFGGSVGRSTGVPLTIPAAPAQSVIDGTKALGDQTVTPKVDTSQIEGVTPKVDAAKQKFTELGSASARPTVDTSSIAAAETAVDRLAGKIAALGGAASAAASRIASVQAPGRSANPGWIGSGDYGTA